MFLPQNTYLSSRDGAGNPIYGIERLSTSDGTKGAWIGKGEIGARDAFHDAILRIQKRIGSSPVPPRIESLVDKTENDLVLANPPYYSHFRIARLFVDIAARALRKAGTLLLVTKTPQWYVEQLPKQFASVASQPVGNYLVITAEL